MMRVFVSGVSVWGPGLAGWEMARAVLRGERPWTEEETMPPAPSILAANERRRTSPVVRLALAVAQEATAMSGHEPASLHSVFGSSNGDGVVVNDILQALAEPGRDVSPTQFHNSVHNAAAGYWTIGAGTRQPASCLGCHDATMGLSLLKAAAEVHVEQVPVLLCVYDRPLPEPMAEKRSTTSSFGSALVLTPDREPGSIASLAVRYRPDPADPALEAPRREALQALCSGNAAARALRLLESLATHRIELSCLAQSIEIIVTPCSTAPAS
jgi:hypothetical protein